MAITANQKYYIKKNWERLEPKRLAVDLGLSEKDILKYLKAHLPKKKYHELAKQSIRKENLPTVEKSSFNLGQFFLDNINMILGLGQVKS